MNVDINCDLGEGMDNDAVLMPYLDSCNIACGGHFGDQQTMLQAIKLAKLHNVKVGAHPSFPDKHNFGRKIIEITAEQLQYSLYHQIEDFVKACTLCDMDMHHIKLHGALYNLAASDAEVAALVLNVFAAVKADIAIYVPYQSAIAVLAEDYFPVIHEAFIDRRYHNDLRLVSRSRNDALIVDPTEAWQQMSDVIETGHLTSVEGNRVKISAQTFCLHGDEEGAVAMIQHISKCLGR